jgi:2,4-dienoyl-CoA reductase-like NADH-dependent reductase (Old Yellow Enzyme family)
MTIFQAVKDGPLTVKNRSSPPAEPCLCTRDGLVTDEFIAFTAAFAKGGAGIVTVGDSPVTQEYANENHYVVNLADPFVVHGLFKLTDAIHRYGAVASIELNLRTHVLPADMSKEEISGIIKAFTDAAVRCKKGGFDMIMIHGGHGHTVAQFYSPLMNKRTDEYGYAPYKGASAFENRCRFANELLDSIRTAVGPEMAVEWRISGDELTEGGVDRRRRSVCQGYRKQNRPDPRLGRQHVQPLVPRLHHAEHLSAPGHKRPVRRAL